MPSILDPPPSEIAGELADLRDALDRDIPAKGLDRNLLIATWNLRAFGDLTEKWAATETDEPKRDLHALLCIGEILSRFDVIALQEVRANLRCLRQVLAWLGPDWGLILTDVTRGAAGNGERMAFVFDQRKVHISGLAAELVLSKEELQRGISPDALQEQFARTPYAVSFRCGGQTFVLVTLHVLYGEHPEQRTAELRAIAEWMADSASDAYAWDRNLIALGDFNIDRLDDERYRAFTSTGLVVPSELRTLPRSIFDEPADPAIKFYDQIAWFNGEDGAPQLTLTYHGGGSFDFVGKVLQNRGLTKQRLSWRISDHYPLWVEFLVRRWS